MEYGRILIVDDSATSRMIIKRCFEIAGLTDAEYLEAEDGLRALSLLDNERVDLVLSDIKMPKMDGTTFIRKLRANERTRTVPVVVISSIGDAETQRHLAECRVQAVIRKPISPSKVSEALNAPVCGVGGTGAEG